MESNISIFFIIEIIGTVAFASSGALVAIKQRLDLLGVVVLGVTTAVGGGMLRDILLGIVPPSLFMNPVYVYTAFLTAMVLFILVWLNQQILESRYISAYEKIRKEAPYHALTNAGHISYVELDGDVCKNIDAFESVIRCMKEAGIGYGSVNHPVDRDPVCGYNGIIDDVCPRCGRHDGEGLDIEVLRKIKGYIRDVRSEEERLEAEDKMPNMVI